MSSNPSIHLDLSQHPELWADNTEYNFGNGLYGQKFTGSVSSTTSRQYKTLLTNVASIIKYGGSWKAGDSDLMFQWNDEVGNMFLLFRNENGLQFAYKSQTATTYTYNIWVLYTKSTS